MAKSGHLAGRLGDALDPHLWPLSRPIVPSPLAWPILDRPSLFVLKDHDLVFTRLPQVAASSGLFLHGAPAHERSQFGSLLVDEDVPRVGMSGSGEEGEEESTDESLHSALSDPGAEDGD